MPNNQIISVNKSIKVSAGIVKVVNQPSQALIASENGHNQPSNRRKTTQDKCDQ